ncbi:MAG: hypothetical protein KGI42_03690 [Xanthomonadaceae bacterium]|nr:hypothetical protein [Xanthomonadaceae bacterium]
MSHTVRLCQPRLRGALLAAAVALALSACSSSSNQETSPATAPAAPNVAPAAKFSAYTAAIPATPANAQCALDAINARPAADVAPLAADSDIVFGGWAGNGKGQAAKGFLLVLKGDQSYSAPIVTNVARADVAKAVSSDGMANSGFNLTVPLTGVAAGTYQAFIVDSADASNVCDLHRSIVVR